MKNEAKVASAVGGGTYSPEEFAEACMFFTRLTGLEIRGNGTYLGLLPNEHTADDLKSVQEWYRKNNERIYWDEGAQAVKVEAPAGAAGALWWKHERVLIRLASGERLSADEFGEAARFFRDLTGIAVSSTDRGLVDWRFATEETYVALRKLHKWYDLNREKLYVDLSSGEARLALRP